MNSCSCLYSLHYPTEVRGVGLISRDSVPATLIPYHASWGSDLVEEIFMKLERAQTIVDWYNERDRNPVYVS